MTARTISRTAFYGFVLLAVAVAGVAIGRFASGGSEPGQLYASMPRLDNASRGDSLSMATGFIDVNEGVEALYALDHLTGELHCWLLNSRTGAVASAFTAKPGADLQVTGEADFVMTTGLMDFVGMEGNVRPSHSVVYVGDGNTGKVVGYVLMYNRGAVQRNEPVQGELRLISNMVTRGVDAVRDQGK
jgi:hypothetical protein